MIYLLKKFSVDLLYVFEKIIFVKIVIGTLILKYVICQSSMLGILFCEMIKKVEKFILLKKAKIKL